MTERADFYRQIQSEDDPSASLESLAAAVGDAQDPLQRGVAMRELALGNQALGNNSLAEAWAERALDTHEIFSMRNPNSQSIKKELVITAGIYAIAIMSAASDKGGELPDYRQKARRAIDIAINYAPTPPVQSPESI
jgi:hypothetical protein